MLRVGTKDWASFDLRRGSRGGMERERACLAGGPSTGVERTD